MKQHSPRLLLPYAVVAALTALCDELEVGDGRRPYLLTLRSQLCRLYRLTDPMAPLSEVEAAHIAAEMDGDPIEDTI